MERDQNEEGKSDVSQFWGLDWKTLTALEYNNQNGSIYKYEDAHYEDDQFQVTPDSEYNNKEFVREAVAEFKLWNWQK